MRLIAAFTVAVALALAPASAFADDSSTCQSYNPQLCNIKTTQTTGTNVQSAHALPFTGLDVALLAAGGAILLGGGLVVRRLSTRLN